MLNKKILPIFLILLFCFFNINVCASDALYVWSTSVESSTIATNNSSSESSNFLNLTSPSAILIEQSTGKVLYSHNIHEKLRPASVTKVMTILLIMEALDNGQIHLTDKVPCSENASNMGGSQIWLNTKEELTIDEMLKAICVVSANEFAHHNHTNKIAY